jgi:hypothetical protein
MYGSTRASGFSKRFEAHIILLFRRRMKKGGKQPSLVALYLQDGGGQGRRGRRLSLLRPTCS